MAANQGQNGIQHLLAAEQEAQQIVNTARAASNCLCGHSIDAVFFERFCHTPKYQRPKNGRLKQAKEEADKEIAAFRAHMDAEFQKKVAQSSGDSGANVKRLEQETTDKIEHLKTEATRISHDVVDMLLKYVTTVKN